MNILKKVVFALAGLVLLLLVVGLFLPSKITLERSVLIKGPAEKPFVLVNDLKKNALWSPWQAEDPTMKITYGEKTVGKGSSFSWTSENSGSGTQVIAVSEPNRHIVTALDFGEMGKATAAWTFVEKDGSTEVTWSFLNDVGWNITGRYFGLMMDGMLGPYYERGLAALKKEAEK